MKQTEIRAVIRCDFTAVQINQLCGHCRNELQQNFVELFNFCLFLYAKDTYREVKSHSK